MGDGTVLRADVYRPDTRERLPVLLQRTPYNKSAGAAVDVPLERFRAVEAGYCVVIQDVRGRYGSEGIFTPFQQELADGRDTVAWAIDRPWSDGRVGMYGASYVGATQWLAAGSEAPLAAIAPFLTASDWHDGWLYDSGVFRLGFALLWSLRSLASGEAIRRGIGLSEVAAAIDRIDSLYRGLDPSAQALLRNLTPYYEDWASSTGRDSSWDRLSPRVLPSCTTVPALNSGGWYDLFLAGTIENYRRARAGGIPTQLVVGPWAHAAYSGVYPERTFGHAASVEAVDLGGLHLRWFDSLLKGIAPNPHPSARVFVMGPDRWIDMEDWPPPDIEIRELYLRSSGRLTTERPAGEPASVYRHNWTDPIPSTGGATYLPGLVVAANTGPRDISRFRSRRDLLHFESHPLSAPLWVAGDVRVELYARSEASGMHFTATLLDVHPAGRAEVLATGIGRLDPALTRKEGGRVEISLGHTCSVIANGHAIGLRIASSDFPRWALPPNETGIAARNEVLHEPDFASRLHLPVVPEPYWE